MKNIRIPLVGLILAFSIPAIAAVVVGSWTSTVVAVPGPDWQNTGTIGVVAGLASDPPSSASNYGDCDEDWAHFEYGTTYSCSVAGPGGWCRDVRLSFKLNVEASTVCTYDPPGPSAYTTTLMLDHDGDSTL